VSPRATTLLLALCASLAGACKSEHAAPTPAPSAAVLPSASAAAPLLSETAAHALIVDNCLSCHTEEMLAQQRLTPKQWASVVKKMQGWGAPVEPENIDPLVAYLAVTYGPTAGPTVVATVSPAAAEAAIAPQPDGPFAGGDAARGAIAYHDLCAACHADNAHGAALGVALADRPLLYRAADFAHIVRAGRGRMPAFRSVDVPDPQLADLLAHLRTLR
jgi:mono/diheme cytochrome c family protein